MPEVTLEQVKDAIEKQGKTWHEEKKVLEQKVTELEKQNKAAAETVEKLAKMEKDMVELGSIKASFTAMERALKRLPGNVAAGKELAEDHSEVKQEFREFFTKGKHSQDGGRSWQPKNEKSLSLIADPDGGYFVPVDLSGRTVQRVFETSPIRAYASVQTISTAELEGMYDDNEFSCGMVAEQAARTATNTAQIGRWKIPVHEEYALVNISQTLLDDANLDVEAWSQRKIGDKFARNENDQFTNGNGVTGPKGFLTYTSGTTLRTQIQQVNTGASGDVTYAGLVSLRYSLKGQYAARATMAGNRTAWSKVRGLVDDQHRPLWEMAMAAGQPDRVFGIPIAEFNDMPDPASASLSFAIADWQEAYQIVDRMGMRILRDPFSNKPFVVIYATKRFGGAVLNTEAIKIGKCST